MLYRYRYRYVSRGKGERRKNRNKREGERVCEREMTMDSSFIKTPPPRQIYICVSYSGRVGVRERERERVSE